MARKVAGAPLKTLRLSIDDCISMKTQEWLKNHVEVLEFFEASDTEEEVEVDMDEESGEEDEGDDDDDDDDDDDEEDEDEDEDPTLGPHGVPVTPITQYLRRTGIGRSSLD
jgi:cobalamin biosynthesis protein CobT